MTITVFCFLATSILQTANAGDIPKTEWSKTFGGEDDDEGYSVEQTTDGGYIIVGETHSYSSGEDDVWLIKTDTNGNELWNRTFGGESYDVGHSVQQTTDGGYIIAGGTFSYASGNQDVWLIKTNVEGKEIWNKTYGGVSYEWGNSIQQTSDGGYIVVGVTNSFGFGNGDVWLIKTNADGIEQWNKTFGGKNWDAGHSVQKTRDGGYIIAGDTQSFGSGYDDVWLIKTDATGVEQWNKTYGGVGYDCGWSVQQTNNGGLVIVGETQAYGNSEGDAWLIKTNADGVEQWNKTYGGQYRDEGYSVQLANDDGYVIGGVTNFYDTVGRDIWLIKINANGIEQWNMTFGSTDKYDIGYFAKQTSDGKYIIVGSTRSYGAGEKDICLIKVTAPNYSAETNSKGTPGFELIFVVFALALVLLLKRKRIS